jgi:hypothetical protein
MSGCSCYVTSVRCLNYTKALIDLDISPLVYHFVRRLDENTMKLPRIENVEIDHLIYDPDNSSDPDNLTMY